MLDAQAFFYLLLFFISKSNVPDTQKSFKFIIYILSKYAQQPCLNLKALFKGIVAQGKNVILILLFRQL